VLRPAYQLFARLLYGTGMCIGEGLQLRVKDVEFGHRAIIVREGKSGKDRSVMLPQSLVPALHDQLARPSLVGPRSAVRPLRRVHGLARGPMQWLTTDD